MTSDLHGPSYYDAESYVECYLDGDGTIRVIADTNLAPEKAREFANALLACVEAVS